MEQQVAVDGQEEQSNWTTFLKLIKICGQCCYVFCPPVPELVTRKLAFHPPPKAFTYRIVLKDGTEAKSAKDLLGKEFGLVLTDGIRTVSPQENRRVMSSIDTFVTTTIYGNQLVGARIRPTVMSVSYSSFDRADVEQVIIFSQPNSSDLGYMLHPCPNIMQRMSDFLGCDIYCFDYSGYGFSTGSPSEKNIYADVQAIYDYIRQTRPDVRIVLMGFSIGTTASVHLASQNPVNLAGVVLLAAFWSGLSLLRQKKQHVEDRVDYFDRFRNIDRVSSIRAPVLLVHGTDDEVCPIEHSQEMFKMLEKPVAPLWIYGGNHSSILAYPATNLRIKSFMRNETETLDIGPFLMAHN